MIQISSATDRESAVKLRRHVERMKAMGLKSKTELTYTRFPSIEDGETHSQRMWLVGTAWESAISLAEKSFKHVAESNITWSGCHWNGS